jgi:glutathione S-transferase
MYQLYWSPATGAFVVEAVLEELGLPYERVRTITGQGEHRKAAYVAMNPLEQIPSLVLPDGTVMTETAAIVMHLCDCRPEAGLLPEPGSSERARAYRWLVLLAVNFYEADLRFYYPGRYTADPAGLDGVKQAAVQRMDRLLEVIEKALEPGPWLLGDRFSACDLYLFMLALWHPARQALLDEYPRLAGLMRTVRQRPSVERIWHGHYPDSGEHPWSTWTGSSAS